MLDRCGSGTTFEFSTGVGVAPLSEIINKPLNDLSRLRQTDPITFYSEQTVIQRLTDGEHTLNYLILFFNHVHAKCCIGR